MAKTLMENIEDFIKTDKLELEFGEGKKKFKVEVTQDVALQDIYSAIVGIVAYVTTDNEFDYEKMNIVMPYYIIKLFTNIPIPLLDGDSGLVDHEKCYNIATRLDLKQRLYIESPIIATYLEMIERNVWRRLEYEKSLAVNNKTLDALGEFYNVMDTLGEIAESMQGANIETLMSQVGDVASKLSLVDDVKREQAENDN